MSLANEAQYLLLCESSLGPLFSALRGLLDWEEVSAESWMWDGWRRRRSGVELVSRFRGNVLVGRRGEWRGEKLGSHSHWRRPLSGMLLWSEWVWMVWMVWRESETEGVFC